jgi:hypothetical protein
VALEEGASRREAGRVAVGPLESELARDTSIAPRPLGCPDGDPLARTDVWATGDGFYEAFQSADRPYRVRPIEGPFGVELLRGSARLTGRVVGPFPRITLTSPDGGRIVGRVPAVLDTIGVGLARREVELTFRGVLDLTSDPRAQRLVVELVDAFGIVWAGAGWSSRVPVIPRDLPRPGPAPQVEDPPTELAALDDELSTTAAVERFASTVSLSPEAAGARAAGSMPFPADAPGSRRGSPGADSLADLRAEAASVVPASQALDGTLAIGGAKGLGVHPLYALRAGETPIAAVAEPARVVAPPPLAPPPLAPPPPAAPARASAPVPDDPDARLRAAQREIWRGERSVREILAARGLSLVEWRAFRRRSSVPGG